MIARSRGLVVLAILQSVARATYPTRDHQERTSTLLLFYCKAITLLYFVIKRGAATFILVKGARNPLSF